MSRFLTFALNKYIRTPFQMVRMSGSGRSTHWTLAAAGNREQVGFGINGNPNYADRPDYPFPAVRWKEPTPELCCLWEKEKGDWGKLTREEKKELYRASFRQTYAEFGAFSPEWKFIIGMLFWGFSIVMWFHYLSQLCYNVLPKSFCPENRAAQLRRILDLRTNPIEGISSKWNYEKNCWK